MRELLPQEDEQLMRDIATRVGLQIEHYVLYHMPSAPLDVVQRQEIIDYIAAFVECGRSRIELEEMTDEDLVAYGYEVKASRSHHPGPEKSR